MWVSLDLVPSLPPLLCWLSHPLHHLCWEPKSPGPLPSLFLPTHSTFPDCLPAFTVSILTALAQDLISHVDNGRSPCLPPHPPPSFTGTPEQQGLADTYLLFFCTPCSCDLEEAMAAHSSILAWRIPWTEEAGGLQSMGRKDWDTTEATEHTCSCEPLLP